MGRAIADRAAAVLRVLADLAPSVETQADGQVIPLEWFHWLPASGTVLFAASSSADGPDVHGAHLGAVSAPLSVPIDRKIGDRLAAVDKVRSSEHSLRLGWLFVVGRVQGDDGRLHRVMHPLVTMPVRVRTVGPVGAASLLSAGDVALTPRISDPQERAAWYERMELGGGALSETWEARVPAALLSRLPRLQRFASGAAAAAGFNARELVPGGDDPDVLLRRDRAVVVAGLGIYAVHEAGSVSRAGSLRTWSTRDLSRPTAFHSVYVDQEPEPLSPVAPLPSPFVLTPAQRAVVASARAHALTVVSGAPGTGKSHTIVAVAVDAVARGETVLIAAKTDAAVDALLDLLERAPGPDPVVFGSTDRRQALAARLAAGQLAAVEPDVVIRQRDKLAAVVEGHREVRQRIVSALRAELLLADPSGLDAERWLAPGLFSSEQVLAGAGASLARWRRAGTGAIGRWRARRAWRRFVDQAGCDADVDADDLDRVLAAADSSFVAARFADQGGVVLGDAWSALGDRERAVREAAGRWIASETKSRDRWNRSSLGAVGAVATALRSGRAARRDQLARLSGAELTQALPLWVGTLPDIDDLLPPVAGLFDLVILDEASGIDQSLAAPALVRGRRAVIAGDPRQLRHVSFLSDERLRTALDAHGLHDDPVLQARLDARRNSAFDVAASAAPVQDLDEHFRSAPHLIHFAAERLYDGRLHIATRSPRTESLDCIEVLRVDGHRNKAGVIEAEVARVLDELRRLVRAGTRSVGVITPFRAQADALEAAVLTTFTVDQLNQLDLRVGTVHAFQGNERDVVLASIGVGPADTGSWRFVQDSHLFAVLITRARRRMTVIISAEPPPGGMLSDYLAQADRPYRDQRPQDVSVWTTEVASELRLAGVEVVTGYRVGRHTLDICLPRERQPTAVECGVHPDGEAAHVARHLDLVQGGWRVLEAFPSRWHGRRGEAVVELLALLGPD